MSGWSEGDDQGSIYIYTGAAQLKTKSPRLHIQLTAL